jgi:hypothetical protein
MRKLIFLLLTLISLEVFGQTHTINNKLTAEHTELPGTLYALIKPDDSYKIATNFTGLENTTIGAGINITELPIGYSEYLPMVTKDLPSEGSGLLIEKDLLMNGFQAKLYKVEISSKSAIQQLEDRRLKQFL